MQFLNALLAPFILVVGLLEFILWPIKKVFTAGSWVFTNKANLLEFIKARVTNLRINWQQACVTAEVNRLERVERISIKNFNGWTKDAHGRWVKQ